MSRAAPKPSVGLWSWGSRVLNGLGPELTKLRKRRNWQARKSIVWVIRPQSTRNGNSASENSQGTERVPKYSQQRKDHALNLRDPAADLVDSTIWSPIYAPSCTPSVREWPANFRQQ